MGVGLRGFSVLPYKSKLAAPTLKMRVAVIYSISYAGSVTFEFLAISHTVSLEQHLSILGSASEELAALGVVWETPIKAETLPPTILFSTFFRNVFPPPKPQ